MGGNKGVASIFVKGEVGTTLLAPPLDGILVKA